MADANRGVIVNFLEVELITFKILLAPRNSITIDNEVFENLSSHSPRSYDDNLPDRSELKNNCIHLRSTFSLHSFLKQVSKLKISVPIKEMVSDWINF